MKLDKDYETQCKQVWIEAWVSTSQASNCVAITTPTSFADECLKQFRLKFPDNKSFTPTL